MKLIEASLAFFLDGAVMRDLTIGVESGRQNDFMKELLREAYKNENLP